MLEQKFLLCYFLIHLMLSKQLYQLLYNYFTHLTLPHTTFPLTKPKIFIYLKITLLEGYNLSCTKLFLASSIMLCLFTVSSIVVLRIASNIKKIHKLVFFSLYSLNINIEIFIIIKWQWQYRDAKSTTLVL